MVSLNAKNGEDAGLKAFIFPRYYYEMVVEYDQDWGRLHHRE